MLKFLRKYHKWFSLLATIFILLFAVSGIILNHREWLSALDVSRKLMPPAYRYNNWNLASVKGAVHADHDTVLLYGNIGVWMTDSTFQHYTDLNQGFPEGMDNRKVSSVEWSPVTGFHAGTLFGLYRYGNGKWHKIDLAGGSQRVVKVLSKGDSLLVMTRSELLVSTVSGGLSAFKPIRVLPATDYDGKVGLFRTLWLIHSGEIYGITGKLLVDLTGILFIILCITGLIWFAVPYRLNALKEEWRRSRLKRINRVSLRWHNVLGSWAILFLLITTITGMFLRPPLLIPIAGSEVDPIPFTELENSNPWQDKFRDLLWDEHRGRFLLATSDGIYSVDDQFTTPPVAFEVQPPVSVMGINVFRQDGPDDFLVGSFSGIFHWNPEEGRISDAVTGLTYQDTGRGGPPFGNVSVAGHIRLPGETEIIFDYANGVLMLKGKNPLGPFPGHIAEVSPISLWNACLEIHTGRIFEPVLGPFYILVVPVVGLMTIIILISGFFSWYLARRKKRLNKIIFVS